MRFPEMREELRAYYRDKADQNCADFFACCTAELDRRAWDNMTPYEMKSLQYKTIAEQFEPILFPTSPFYYENGILAATCDGARNWRGGHKHPGGWTQRRNLHKYEDYNPELHRLRWKQGDEMLYLICGVYTDQSQHFKFDYRKLYKHGLKGVYEKAKTALEGAQTEEETQFLTAMCDGLLALKTMSEKFSEKAKEKLKTATNPEEIANLKRIADAAAHAPWEKPRTFFEALNLLAFMRKAVGALEGVGNNTFGRLDIELYPFYLHDIEAGILTKEEAYDLICKFLITFDVHYDHDMKMVGYADHELENTYVLGGRDIHDKQVFNDITKMCILANREEKIIFPKIMCRFSKNSPKEYFDLINESIVNGTTTVLYHNEDATIPALIRSGKTPEEAKEYLVAGCWGVECHGVEKSDDGNYMNMLKPFEYSIHRLYDKMEEVQLYFKPIDDAESFEEVYQITLDNIKILFEERIRIGKEGAKLWKEVDPLPIISSVLDGCIESRRDFTNSGSKYRGDRFECFGLPNIVDSLMAIKTLCFDEKKYTLAEMLTAVRQNFEGYEQLRSDAIRCHGWGDGNEDSCALANRFNNDLYHIADAMEGCYGGKIHIGHLTYTEIKFWGEKTLALPDGRKNGDYFSQGLTPSRLKKIPSVTSVINSLKSIDRTTLAGDSVTNVILPIHKENLDTLEAFLRTAADSAVQSLQLNCTSREQLLDAQKHPEKYPDLIVRVCGFSAKFSSLSPEWQDEVLTRNFYE